MNLIILLSGVLIFIVCLCMHVIVWRWWHPRRRVVVLFLLFIFLPFFFIIGYLGFVWFDFAPFVISFTIIEWLAIYLIHFVLSSSYILSYPAVEAVSPSLAILLMIGDSNLHGVVHEDLLHVFDDEIVLEPRIQDLIEAGLIIKSEDYLMATSRGSTLVKCFILLRRLLGLPIGKG